MKNNFCCILYIASTPARFRLAGTSDPFGLSLLEVAAATPLSDTVAPPAYSDFYLVSLDLGAELITSLVEALLNEGNSILQQNFWIHLCMLSGDCTKSFGFSEQSIETHIIRS